MLRKISDISLAHSGCHQAVPRGVVALASSRAKKRATPLRAWLWDEVSVGYCTVTVMVLAVTPPVPVTVTV